MSAGVLVVVIIVVVIVVAGLAAVVLTAARRRRLQQRFGPEYDRAVSEKQSQLKAEAELAGRERRVHSLNLRPLDDASRAEYASRWAITQEQFVDRPQEAVAQAQLLVTAVMRELGYPTEDDGQILADLSVQHANTLQHYRAAQAISEIAAVGNASTEDLRQAMIQYRILFSDLLGEPPGQQPAAPGRSSAMTGDQPEMAADHPEMAAERPGMADDQPVMPGKQPRLPAEQHGLAGDQPAMAGEQPGPPGAVGAGPAEDWAAGASDQPARRTRRS